MPILQQFADLNWGGEEGGRNECIIHVNESYWAADQRYQEGTVLLLHLLGPGQDEDGVLSQENEHEMWPCGKGWTSDDNELTYHESKNPKRKFNQKSWIYMFIDRIINTDNEEFIEGLATALIERYGSPNQYDARIYNNLILKLVRKEVEFGQDKDGNTIKASRLMPVEFLGWADGWVAEGAKKTVVKAAGTANGAAKPAAAAAAKVVTPAEEEAEDEGGLKALFDSLPKPLKARLNALAKKNGPKEFESAALDVEEVTSNSDLTVAVCDGSAHAFLVSA